MMKTISKSIFTIVCLVLVFCPSTKQTLLTQDIVNCKKWYPAQQELFKASMMISNKTYSSSPPVDKSATVSSILNNSLIGFLTSNIDLSIIWLLIFAISAISFTLCFLTCFIRLFKKGKVLLNEQKIEKIIMSREKNKKWDNQFKTKIADENHSSSEEECVRDDIELKNHPRTFEFKLLMISKVFLAVMLAVSMIFIRSQDSVFLEGYVELSCKTTHIVDILVNGNMEKGKYLGTQGILKEIETLEGLMNSVTVPPFPLFSESKAIKASTNGLLYQLEFIFNHFSRQKIRSPANESKIEFPFFKEWGPANQFNISQGILRKFADEIREVYGNLIDSTDKIKNSAVPPLRKTQFQEDIIDSEGLKILQQFKEKVKKVEKVILDSYEQFSDSNFQLLFSIKDMGFQTLTIILYVPLASLYLLGLIFDFIFFKKRHLKLMKFLMNLTWFMIVGFGLFVSILLLIACPSTNAMVEIANVMEPMAFNQSFYKQMDYPSPELYSYLHSCFYQGGDFLGYHPFNNLLENFGNTKEALALLDAQSQNVKLDTVLTEYNSLIAALDSFADFTTQMYNPSDQNNPEELRAKQNGFTDCLADPYTKFGFNIHQQNECQTAGCRSTDFWVWNVANCPTGTVVFSAGDPVNTSVRYCVAIKGQTNSKLEALTHRYPIDCWEGNTMNTYRSESTYLSRNMAFYAVGVEAEVINLKTNFLSLAISPDTPTGIAAINTKIVSSIQGTIQPISISLDPIFQVTEKIQKHKNCKFIKENWLSMRDSLREVQSTAETASYFALPMIFLLLCIGLISFLMTICFDLIEKPTGEGYIKRRMGLITTNNTGKLKNGDKLKGGKMKNGDKSGLGVDKSNKLGRLRAGKSAKKEAILKGFPGTEKEAFNKNRMRIDRTPSMKKRKRKKKTMKASSNRWADIL